MRDLRLEAIRNLIQFNENPYVGRFVIVGLDSLSRGIYLVEGITVRSPPNRNRVLVDKGGGLVKTEVADPSEPSGNAELTLYAAMREHGRHQVVSNGQHTDAILSSLMDGHSVLKHLTEEWRYEPDGPTYTPRIAAWFSIGGPLRVEMMAIIKLPGVGTDVEPLREYSVLQKGKELMPGVGWCLRTYETDGSPPASYDGIPRPLPLAGPINFVADRLWKNIHQANRVALAVKYVPLDGGPSKVVVHNYRKQVLAS